jgi:hypothetical protein
MQMEVKNGLACAAPVIHHRPVTVEQIQFAGKLRGNELQFSENRLIFGSRVVERREVFAWANQYVGGRLRADVFKREYLIVFVNDLGRNLPRRDLAKQAVSVH